MSNNYKGKRKGSKDYHGSKARDNRKGPDKKDSIEKTGLDNRGRDNDPNDYFYSKELAEQATQLSFQNMLGLGTFNGYEIPTICRVALNPCPGISYLLNGPARYDAWKEDPSTITPQPELSTERAGLNMMCRKLYTLLSTFSGRTSNYGPQDVGIMILAISSVAELSEHIRRVFGVALTYNARNRTMPLELIRAMGVDPGFISSISDFRMRFNVQMSRINQIPLLDNIGFIRKSRNLFQKVYQDDVSSMSQLFFFAPYSIWVMDEASSPRGSVLSQVRITNAEKTMDTLLTYLNTMITRLLESTTLNLIYADLLNLANKIKVPTWQFDYLAENYVVMPEYNRTASMQFHNMNIVGSPATLGGDVPTGMIQPSGWDIFFTRDNNVYTDVDTNDLVYNPVFQSLYKSRPASIIDMPTDSPDIVDRIEALRFSCVPSGWYIKSSTVGQTSEVNYGIFPTLADHYVVDLKLFGNKANSNSQIVGKIAYCRDVDSVDSFTRIMSRLESFKDCPIIEFYNTYSMGMDTEYQSGDLTFYTEIDYEYLKKVNSMMYVGLFDFRV